MKKDVLKKGLQLQLHRETLRALENAQLPEVAGGSVTTCAPTCIPCTTYSRNC
jgi:hypothetical protein